MSRIYSLAVALAAAAFMPIAAAAAEDPPVADVTPTKCLKAMVNPVTGHAICLEPKGAPVDPPERSALQRPCPPRARDDDPFTMYEHWSGCH